MTRFTLRLVAASALALAAASPALADKADKLLVDQYRQKIAEARANPAVAANGSAELTEADGLLPSLAKNLDKDEAKEARDIGAQIDALIATARTKAQTEVAKKDVEAAKAEGAARVSAAEAAAADAQAAAAAAQQQAAAAQADSAALRRQMAEYQLKQSQLGATLVLQDVVFETGKAELKSGAAERLRPMAAYLQANPQVRVRIDGHTDAQGSDSYNQELSAARANSVRAALASMGVDAGRIEAVGHGESQPAADNATPAGRQQNRRVEVTLVGQQASSFAALN
jgi:outer membrane protein OmpA-like peptidoglycan-associated protein